MQYQAGYILDAVRNALLDQIVEQKPELNGLYRSLSTFTVTTPLKMNLEGKVPSLLAVAANLITRGFPTLPSIRIEEQFSQCLGITTRKDDDDTGKIGFPLVSTLDDGRISTLFQALHVIEPRAKNRLEWLDTAATESAFERDFLLKYIPQNESYLTQLLEKQRRRNTLPGNFNRGRTDFSLEIPYEGEGETLNRYKQNVKVKNKKIYLVEVDGARYHSSTIDDIKDSLVKQLPIDVHRIREATAHADRTHWLQSVTNESYIQRIAANYKQSNWLTDPWTALVLSPFCIARIQIVLLHYLITNFESGRDNSGLNIAIIERDIPGGHLALPDLQEQLYTLNELAQTQIALPVLNYTIFVSEEFHNHPLHGGNTVLPVKDLDATHFDFIIDVSVLRREGVFREDAVALGPNSIQIRSSHFIQQDTATAVISAAPVEWRSLVIPLPNETYQSVEITVGYLSKFLQDIFRKKSFREGQLPILNRALQLKSVIGLLPTGGGKSLTYQLAALLQPGTTIIIDPIRSLMTDQYNGLREIAIDQCGYINSTLETVERVYNQQLMIEGRFHFIFVSPERLVIDEFRNALESATRNRHFFSYVVIDEVHCVSEWGHDFRTPYLNLGENARKFCRTSLQKPIPLFGLTATASFDVLADIERELQIQEDDGHAVVHFENSVRNEINYMVLEVPHVFENNTISEWKVREIIGSKKQHEIFRLLQHKENLLQQYNQPEILNENLKHSFTQYLPHSRQLQYEKQAGNKTAAISAYQKALLKRIRLADEPFRHTGEGEKIKYGYGVIVFMPHRQGWLGIHGSGKASGVFNHPGHTVQENELINRCKDEQLGYFMGSSDDDNAERTDRESFQHLDWFKKNRISIMVATKAFGMGIDKPNIRMTVHSNIPSSIESFVQEAGRAGRDGRTSLSAILFNNSKVPVSGKPAPYHLDTDILMYFHNNSFKGQIKERVMIYEIRSRITFPVIRRLKYLTGKLNESFGSPGIQFQINLGQNNHIERIFINDNTGAGVGFIYLTNQQTGVVNNPSVDRNLSLQLATWLKKQLPFKELNDLDSIRSWLTETISDNRQEEGLEHKLADLELGQTGELIIPFVNRYYSQKATSTRNYEFNPAHGQKVLATQAIKRIIQARYSSDYQVTSQLSTAVQENQDYQTFLDSLNIPDKEFKAQLSDIENPLSLELQQAYYYPRAKDDTAKAIYRLTSIGVIDSYTIDYQNNFYTIHFTKKEPGDYYKALEILMARYTSRHLASIEIGELKKNAAPAVTAGKATILSKCLEKLTEFIYDKIQKKRLQAINDMVRLCQTTILIKDFQKQNEYIRDEIYYYFNARYSRRGNSEDGTGASMPDDLAARLSPGEMIEKYLNLAGDGRTGEFISNIKHLRGSCMRMLRSNPEAFQFRILKSFALFILADTVSSLTGEAKDELVQGLLDWKKIEDLDVPGFIRKFLEKIEAHIPGRNILKTFDDIEDRYYTIYYTGWLKEFRQRFTAQT